ncbi:hypothetical protein LguiA_025192 [Lonicera macranthoides]
MNHNEGILGIVVDEVLVVVGLISPLELWVRKKTSSRCCCCCYSSSHLLFVDSAKTKTRKRKRECVTN